MADPSQQPARSGPDGTTSLTLLQRLRANEAEAWTMAVRLYSPLVWYWCGRAGVHGADADDVTQEVFQAASTSLDHFRRDRPGDSFRGWLRGITRFKVLGFLSQARRQPQGAGGSDLLARFQEVPDPASVEEEEAETSLVYRRAIELIRTEFEERTWEAFRRAVLDGRPPDEVAAALGVSPAAVRKAKSRVLLRLREALGELLE
jgi:RNA polymerase sigma-70 factor (ECF subfamily)